jgi:hypothetical protein
MRITVIKLRRWYQIDQRQQETLTSNKETYHLIQETYTAALKKKQKHGKADIRVRVGVPDTHQNRKHTGLDYFTDILHCEVFS